MIYSPSCHSKHVLERKKNKKNNKKVFFVHKMKVNGVQYCLESNAVHTNFLYVLQKKESLERHEDE